jgi:hypothetical protein
MSNSSRDKGARLCFCGCGGRPALYKAEYIRGHRPKPTPEEEFAHFRRRVIEAPGCWIWTGHVGKNGYGQVQFQGRLIGTHRLMMLEARNFLPIPRNLFVCHHCDNPPCCNPKHLFLGTVADNARDAKSKGRTRAPRGMASPNARLTIVQVEKIKERVREGETRVAVAKDFEVTPQYVGQLVHGYWRKYA